MKKQDSWGRFDFLGISKYLTVISVSMTIGAVLLIVGRGFNYGVDFAGGVEIQVQFKEAVEPEAVRKFMADNGFPKANVQALEHNKEYLMHVGLDSTLNDEESTKFINESVAKIKGQLASTFTTQSPELRRVDTVGPQVGSELRRKGVLAGFYCMLLILVYVGLRFDYRFAPAAVFCLFHDALVTMAIYSIFDWEFTVQTMAAILTIIGYSLNDTIVIFDRIRENQPLYRDKELFWVANLSLNETLSRTILTFFTTFLTVAAMFFIADGVIKDFARTMMIGMILGVYSTVYVATPLMLAIDKYQRWKKAQLQTA